MCDPEARNHHYCIDGDDSVMYDILRESLVVFGMENLKDYDVCAYQIIRIRYNLDCMECSALPTRHKLK